MYPRVLLGWSSRSITDLSWDPAIVNSGDVSLTDGVFSVLLFTLKTPHVDRGNHVIMYILVIRSAFLLRFKFRYVLEYRVIS